MTDWDYAKDGGNNYAVEPGDIWSAGPHMLACGDLERGDGEQFVIHVGRPDLAYIDPPWNSALARGFRTKSGLDGEKGREVDFQKLLDRIVGLAAMTKGSAFLEMGRQQVTRLRTSIIESGGTMVGEWPITYYRTRPCLLIQASWGGRNIPHPDSPEGLDDDQTPGWAILRFTKEGGTVMDVCTGRGLTAVAAEALGRKFTGLELHPKRLSVTLTKLAARGGYEPQKIGILPNY